MTLKRRVLFARLILPIFFAWLVMLPYREARAFVAPPGVIPPPAFVATAGGSPAAIALGALTVGAVVGYLLVGAAFGDSTEDAVRIQLNTSTNAVPPAPTAPATTTPTATIYSAGAYTGNSPGEACTKWAASYGTQCVPSQYGSLTTSGPTSCVFTWPCASSASVSVTSSVGCPVGYTNVSGVCNLTNSRLLASDYFQDILINGSGSSKAFTIPADVDNPGTVDGTQLAPLLRGDGSYTKTAYVYGVDSSGRPVLVEVAISPDGTQTYVRHYTQDDSTGQSQIVKTQATIDNGTGTVTGIQNDIQVGTITAPTASNLTQVSTSTPTSFTSPQVTTTTATPVSNSTQQQPIVFPTDYARTGEAATAASQITPKLDTLHHDLTDQTTAPADPTLPDAGTYTDFGGTFDGLKGWSLPGHTSQCPTGSFGALGSTYTIDSHCILINDHWSALQAAMTAVWTTAALFLVLRA